MKQFKYIAYLLTLSLFASCMQSEGFLEPVSGEEAFLNLECVTMGEEEVVVTKAWENTTEAER